MLFKVVIIRFKIIVLVYRNRSTTYEVKTYSYNSTTFNLFWNILKCEKLSFSQNLEGFFLRFRWGEIHEKKATVIVKYFNHSSPVLRLF